MLTRRSIPRTLRGVGGVRLINMPGVKYPDAVVYGRKGADVRSGKPYEKAPEWGISTREAAGMLGISARAARALLNRHQVAYQLVARPGSSACLYWDRNLVQQMTARRMPMVSKVPDKLCSAHEACYLLMVVRSSLSRYVKQGLIKEYRLRLATSGGVRVLSYYLRAEIRKLAARKNAARLRSEGIQRDQLRRLWDAADERRMQIKQGAKS